MKKALLVLDNPHREMRGMYAISNRLKKKGIFSYIVSKNTFTDWYDIFEPDFVILPRASSPFFSFIKKNYLKTKIIVIPIEHGGGDQEKVLNHNFGAKFSLNKKIDTAIEFASLILVGGENQKKWMSDAIPNLSNKIKVVGTLSSDHWFKLKKKPIKKLKIGICTTFKSIFLTANFDSTIKILYDHLSEDYVSNRWRLNFQNYEIRYLSHLLEVIDLLVNSGYEVEIRPHPHENWNGWLRWLKSNKNKEKISLNRSIDITSWIDSLSVCITSFSTTTFDCISRGVPTISIDKFIPDEIISSLPKNKNPLTNEFSWRPNSLQEIKNLILKLQSNKIDISPNLENANSFIKKNFFWPREKSTASICVDYILNLDDKEIKNKKKNLNTIFKTPLILLKIMCKDILNYFFHPRKSNLLFIFSFKIWYSAYKFNKEINSK